MSIIQTFSEMGLERGVIVAWAEPRCGQRMKPRFGKRPFSRKLLYAFLILVAYICIVTYQNSDVPLSPIIFVTIVLYIFLIGAFLIAVSYVIMKLLDYAHKRNIWIYTDGVLITHARDRVTLRKPDIKSMFVYQVGEGVVYALETLLNTGKSYVVVLPSEIESSVLVERLRNLDYLVEINA